MKIQCECCGSQDMWKASVAYSQGRSSGSYAGSSYSSDGYGSHGGSFSSLTDFARRAAPPNAGVSDSLARIIGFSVLTVFGFNLHPLIGLCGILVVLYYLLKCIYCILRLPWHFKKKSVWQKSWICGRCGTLQVNQLGSY